MARILVVEDDPDMRDLIEDVLTGDGHEVLTAGDGRRALDRLAKGPKPDLVLLDLLLPVLDGREVLKAIRGDPRLSDLPVALMSGYRMAELQARGLGADLFVPKPLEPDVLLHKLADLAARGRHEVAPDGASTSAT